MKKPSPLLVALIVGLAACQPHPAQTAPPPAQPGQSMPPGSPASPADPTPVIQTLSATVVIPSGAINKLQTGLRTQATAPVTADDLANFKLSIGGQVLTADQFSFAAVHLDPQGHLVATLTVSDAALVPGTIVTLSTPSGSIAMKGFVPAHGTSVRIDVTSTAQALIAEKLQADGKTTDLADFPAQAVQLVVDRLMAELTGSGTGDVLSATKVVLTVAEVTDAITGGKGTDSSTLTRIRHMFDSSGGGGGGGGGGIPVIPATTTFDAGMALAVTRGVQSWSDLTFAEVIEPFAATINATRGAQAASDATFVAQ